MKVIFRSICLGVLLPLLALAGELPAATGTIEVVFTPWEDAEGVILRTVAGARRAIYVQAYLLTSRPLARALMTAKQRGVNVEVLADHDMTAKPDGGSQIPLLAAAGIPVFLEVRYAAAHNKIILIDPDEPGNTVVTGSFNFTYSAQARNAENLIVIRGNADVARSYLNNWRRHRAEAMPLAQALPSVH